MGKDINQTGKRADSDAAGAIIEIPTPVLEKWAAWAGSGAQAVIGVEELVGAVVLDAIDNTAGAGGVPGEPTTVVLWSPETKQVFGLYCWSVIPGGGSPTEPGIVDVYDLTETEFGRDMLALSAGTKPEDLKGAKIAV